MRHTLLAVAAIAGSLAAPLAAHAQDTIIRGETVGVAPAVTIGSIADDQRPRFRQYVIEERVPSFTVPERVIVGALLPEAGVTYYDVPERYGATNLRYTVVNDRTVLVEPRTRRIIQVID